jgi:hypothetical protein
MSDGAKPLLAVDVDGVVSLFGFDQPPGPPAAEFKLIEGTMHCISIAAGPRLRLLADHYELVWASGWEGQTEVLTEILELPEHPFLGFGGNAEFGSAEWKIEPLDAYAGGRALAWVDDSFDERCYEWAKQRRAPTLLIRTESRLGLLDVHVEALVGWARSLRSEAESG